MEAVFEGRVRVARQVSSAPPKVGRKGSTVGQLHRMVVYTPDTMSVGEWFSTDVKVLTYTTEGGRTFVLNTSPYSDLPPLFEIKAPQTTLKQLEHKPTGT